MLRNNSRIDYIYFSNIAPADKSVLWLTLVDNKFVLKIYNNGEWQDITGGSSGIKEVKVTIDSSSSGSPSGTGSIDKGILSLNFKGLKGEKGDVTEGQKGIQGPIGSQGPQGI